MEYLVEEDFPVFDVDGMPEDPYTEGGLKIAESAALQQFPTVASIVGSGNGWS
ncbi:MAG: hypothetical protein M3Y77_05080 [Actinomycetota bacterium]|nr:hypothetical protein [Actinomycetota bacterium]